MGFLDRFRRVAKDDTDAIGEAFGVGSVLSHDVRLLGTRDLPVVVYTKQKRIAEYLFHYNPIAKRAIQMIVDFTVGTGAAVEVDDEKTKGWVHDFIKDPWNLWAEKELDRIRDFRLFGELAFLTHTNTETGKVRISYLDTESITDVKVNLSHPELVDEVFVALPGFNRWMKVVTPDVDPLSPTHGLLMGEVLFFRLNNLANATRGISDLFAVADHMELTEKLIRRTDVKIAALNQYFWDVTMHGATATEIERRRQAEEKLGPPGLGEVRFHSEREVWQAVAPDIKSQQQEAWSRFARNHVLGALGIPEHFWSEGTQENLATAKVMGAPFFRRMFARQKENRTVYETIVRYVIDQRIAAWQRNTGLPWSEREHEQDTSFRVVLPDLAVEEVGPRMDVLLKAVEVADKAVVSGMMDAETAQRFFLQTVREQGFEDLFDMDEEMERVKPNRLVMAPAAGLESDERKKAIADMVAAAKRANGDKEA